jgi:hypothetical protein
MELKLLKKDFKSNDHLYEDFLNNRINEEYFSNETVYIREAPDFPIYMGRGSEEQKKKDFLIAFQTVSQSYLDTDREVILDGRFWYSLLLTEKRDYILNKYPEVMDSESKFRNIVLKKFDWENYIYKVILGAQYIADNVNREEDRYRYYEIIVENLDLYNYIIKYEIFRNDVFLINILDIVDELGLSKLMKAKIKGREDLGDDERYGRRVIFEFNKSYPVVMSPMLEKEELKTYFLKYLSYYYKPDESESLGSKELSVESNIIHNKVATASMNQFSHEKDFQVAEKSTATQVLEKQKEEKSSDEDELLIYLTQHGLEYIDHRPKGGSLWVIGSDRIREYLDPLKDKGIHFRFKPTGGRASKHRPAWFWYGK